MKIARLILTFDCPRHCPYCCNNYSNMQRIMHSVDMIEQLAPYDQVLLTGGEPMLQPYRTLAFARALKSQNANRPVYMYTALYDSAISALLPILDGVHYTIQAPASQGDIDGFRQFQDTIKSHAGSFRLYIMPRVTSSVEIIPSLWKRVEVKPWITEGNLVLPPGE